MGILAGLIATSSAFPETAHAGNSSAAAAPAAPATEAPDSALAIEIARAGLEGIAASRAGQTLAVTYENRRFRQPATVLGHVSRLARESDDPPGALWGIERRLGLPSAAMPFRAGDAPDRVIYPGDPSFPKPPPGRRWGASERSLDLILEPILSYELGRIYEPVLVSFDLGVQARMNPWPGAEASASIVIPVRNDFGVDALHPDLDNIRPGASTLEQYMWLPWSVLASASAGLFDDNRYGGSAGLARPMAGGLLWFDTQVDLTGFLAFPDSGVTYSTLGRWTGFAGVTIRPYSVPASLRIRAQRFLYGDQGLEVQVERSLGDVDLALYAQRIEGSNIGGVRLSLPLPPKERGVGAPMRAGLSEQFEIEYRSDVSLQGITISGAASRENLLRKLDTSSFRANREGYLRAAGTPGERPRRTHEAVSLTGMSGMINTPWCGVMPSGDIELGYNVISKEAAYDHRGQHRNDVYYWAVGFLPHAELGLRWTVIPGLKAFEGVAPGTRLTDADRMVSGRLEVIPPRPGRPGLALGIEDAVGTRRFHSEYAVAGLPAETWPLHPRLTLGYAFKALSAGRYTLEGAFGAIAVRPWHATQAVLEHDSEKVNALVRYEAGLGIRARVALLGLRHPAVGLGWSHSL